MDNLTEEDMKQFQSFAQQEAVRAEVNKAIQKLTSICWDRWYVARPTRGSRRFSPRVHSTARAGCARRQGHRGHLACGLPRRPACSRFLPCLRKARSAH